jgi:hypothetical protein
VNIKNLYHLILHQISLDSSRRKAPAAADTESIDGTFIKPGPPARARVGTPSQRSARIELAPPRRRAPWRARRYAGAAQYPCAERRGRSPRVAPSSTPVEARACCPGAPVLPSWAVNKLPGVMSFPPSGHRLVVHVPAGSRPEQLYPVRPHAERGVDGHDSDLAGPRPSSEPQRVPTGTTGPQPPRATRARNSTPPGPGPGGCGGTSHSRPEGGAARTRGERPPITSRAP